MSRVSRKSESLLLDLEREALGSAKKTEDPILTLAAEVKQQGKRIEQLTSQKAKSGGSSGGSSSGKQFKKKDKKGKKPPFPKELRTKEKPSDTTKPLVINDVKYFWCETHKKWGQHPTNKCEKGKNKDMDSSGGKKEHYVKALMAIPE